MHNGLVLEKLAENEVDSMFLCRLSNIHCKHVSHKHNHWHYTLHTLTKFTLIVHRLWETKIQYDCFTFIKFHRFWNFNNIRNIVHFDVPNHCIYKKFQECNAYFFPIIFLVMNTNLEHDLWIFLMKFYPKLIWKSIYL